MNKPSICVFITTYNRPQQCLSLVKSLAAQAAQFKCLLHVLVVDDCSSRNYTRVAKFVNSQSGWAYQRLAENHGKHKYWMVINNIFSSLKRMRRYNYYFMIQDDIEPCRDFFSRSIDLWESISDPRKASVLLLKDARSAGEKGIWTGCRIRRHKRVSKIQFIDCPAFICTAKLFEALNWRILPIPEDRWVRRPNISSGVGEQMSHRLNDSGYSMFVSNKSLVHHRHNTSMMNPEDRGRDGLHALNHVDDEDVIVSIASVAGRKHSLARAVKSLLPQVDRMNVYLNNYRTIPKFLHKPDITVVRSQDHGDIGDRGKFFWVSQINGYHFTCDDDIIYPPDYVTRMLAALKQYNNRAAIGCHASLIKSPVTSYYGSRVVLHFRGELRGDTPVHVLGTGTLAYYTGAINVKFSDFKSNNMADLWFAELGQKQKVPFISISRRANWIRPIEGTGANSIYKKSTTRAGGSKDTGKMQTQIAQRCAPWRVFKP